MYELLGIHLVDIPPFIEIVSQAIFLLAKPIVASFLILNTLTHAALHVLQMPVCHLPLAELCKEILVYRTTLWTDGFEFPFEDISFFIKSDLAYFKIVNKLTLTAFKVNYHGRQY